MAPRQKERLHSFNVAAVQRCLLSTGRAMAQGNALVFLGKEAVLFLPDGRSLLFPVRGSPRTHFPGASFAPA